MNLNTFSIQRWGNLLFERSDGAAQRFQISLDFCAPRRVYFSSMENRTADAVEACPA